MKTVELQIAEYLEKVLGSSKLKSFASAYRLEDFIKGVAVWIEGPEIEMARQGWFESEDIKGKEFIKYNGKTYIQINKENNEFPHNIQKRNPINLYCPVCGSLMDVDLICPKAKGNIHGYRCAVICRNCSYNHYYKEPVDEVLKMIGVTDA